MNRRVKRAAPRTVLPAPATCARPLAYSVPEAAHACRIGTSTLWKYMKDGKGPTVVRLGGRTLVRDAELDRWLVSFEQRTA